MSAYGKHSPDSHQVSHISRATKANFLHFYLLIESRPLQTKCWLGKQFALLSKKHRALGLYGERNKDLCIIRSTSRKVPAYYIPSPSITQASCSKAISIRSLSAFGRLWSGDLEQVSHVNIFLLQSLMGNGWRGIEPLPCRLADKKWGSLLST